MKLESDKNSKIEILKYMQKDLYFLKEKIISMAECVAEIREDIHRETVRKSRAL